MDITWYGYCCFRITERGQTSVLTDPHLPGRELAPLRLRADLVTASHQAAAQGAEQVLDQRYVIAGPGEYELGELFVTGIALHRYDDDSGRSQENVAYHFAYPNGIKVLHLGNLRQVPDQDIIEGFDEVQALLAPIGNPRLNSDQLADLISLIEPTYVLPMRPPGIKPSDYQQAVDSFLKAMGISQALPQDSLRLSPSNLPEQTQVALLSAAGE